MNRFKLYIYVFIGNLIIFILFNILKIEYAAGLINFISFVASIILFLFTLEEPPEYSKLKIPEVHNYYKSRQNDYSNWVAIEFVALSFLFFVFNYSLELNISLSVLILWAISIPVTNYLIIKVASNLEKEKIIHYIHNLWSEYDQKVIESIVSKFINKNTLNKHELIKGLDYSTLELSNIADAYIAYYTDLSDGLTPGEIEEINDL